MASYYTDTWAGQEKPVQIKRDVMLVRHTPTLMQRTVTACDISNDWYLFEIKLEADV